MENLCRLCGRNFGCLNSIFDRSQGMLILDLISIICPIQINVNDSLPKKICGECFEVIQSAVKLRSTSVINDLKFRKMELNNQQELQGENIFFEVTNRYNGNILLKTEFSDSDHPSMQESFFEESDSYHEDVNRRSNVSKVRLKNNNHNMKEKILKKCSICGYSTQITSNLRRHMRNVHKIDTSKLTTIICDICNFKTKTKFKINEHMIFCHLSKDTRTNSCSPSYLKLQESIRIFRCLQCQYTSNYRSNVNRHMRKYHLLKAKSIEL
ncbi:CLUMA_CG008484, isoform A [Clunio marinus]|uniref:CLUMA_CG008484, isoform A n=1 Tax=Clunio marinus TaxID=568069 RepID=A0A1J1I7R0_9DIPT|nr:CLUMA_CG008484, isoform A [Clunio marinus]